MFNIDDMKLQRVRLIRDLNDIDSNLNQQITFNLITKLSLIQSSSNPKIFNDAEFAYLKGLISLQSINVTLQTLEEVKFKDV